MRANLPVVPSEYSVPPGGTLVSTTDLQGRILYCNPAFIEVSGYTREELLGQPHNLIRHPDMPEEAFRDMWETIASGQPWSAPVKNRRKDGTYYWVMANVTPLMEGERPIGYMSVRTVPSRETVAQAEALYATMREEKAAGRRVHRLDGGRLVRDTPAGRLREALALGVPGKTALAGAFAGLACFAAGTVVPEGWRWLGAALAAALAAAAGLVTVKALAIAPLEGLLRHANRMAAGDLTQRISAQRHDLVGRLTRALGQLNVNLQSIVRDARNEVDQMRGVTAEIASGNHDLSSRTESQASSLQETAASMEQITGTVKLSADSAQQASSLAGRATEIAQRSSEAVLGVAKTMTEITEASRRIAAITQTIDGIAFQTNILALNAAVEAARAGEAGRGFAVVAGEVRALAQRASGASREIKSLIENSVEKVEAGSQQSDAARATMDEALASVRQVGALVDEISHGAREQLSGISQINEAVSQLDTITQQNAALVEQIAASASSLEGQSDTLAQTVRVFRLDAGEAAGVDAVALRRAMKRQRDPHAA